MKTAILGLVLLMAGLVSGVARILLFSAMKKKYPEQYAKLGSPSVLFQNFDPMIRLRAVKNEIDEADYKHFFKLKLIINLGEGLLLAAIVIFVLYG